MPADAVKGALKSFPDKKLKAPIMVYDGTGKDEAVRAAMAIVREKERGTVEQLIVTPVRSYELILGKAIPADATDVREMPLGWSPPEDRQFRNAWRARGRSVCWARTKSG